MTQLTVLGDVEARIDAEIDGTAVKVAAASLPEAIGWTLKPEGLCRGAVCVPVRDAREIDGDQVELGALAAALQAPYAAEPDVGVVAFGEPAPLRSAALDDVQAPDFTLDRLGGDHDGEPFTLSTIGAKKKLLVTWASW